MARQRTGSVLCPSCGKLVGVSDAECYHCGRKRPGMFGFTAFFARLGRDLGFVELVIGGCGLLYALMLVADPSGVRLGGLLSFLAPSQESLLRFGASGAYPVFVFGRWWTVLSAGWLHGNLIHIAFNLYWIRLLAPPVAEFYGPSRMVILYTVSSITGFLLSSATGAFLPFFGGAALTVGASAPILGLVGALVHYGKRAGSSAISRQAWYYAVFMLVFGLLFPRVDNWAHVGGFLGGWLAANVLDPLKPERTNHVVAALVCLGLTVAAVVASLVA
jgi:rhomboid protease GluP